jgi:hypothetical protein
LVEELIPRNTERCSSSKRRVSEAGIASKAASSWNNPAKALACPAVGGEVQRKAARTGPLHCTAGGAHMSADPPRSVRHDKTDSKGPW